MMGTGLMSDRDRLDRIERKINRIGRFVLFGIALFFVAAAVLAEGYYDRLVIGYGNVIAAALVVNCTDVFCLGSSTVSRLI